MDKRQGCDGCRFRGDIDGTALLVLVEMWRPIEHGVTMCKRRTIFLEDLPPQLRSSNGRAERVSFLVGSPLAEVERELIGRTCRIDCGNKILAARMLVACPPIYRHL